MPITESTEVATKISNLPVVRLSAGQQKTFDLLLSVVQATPLVILEGDAGLGKTTLLRHLQSDLGACYINLRELLDSISARHPHAVEESFRGLIGDSFRRDRIVILDDFDYLATVTKMAAAYPRPYLLEAVVKSLFADVRGRGDKLVVAQRNPERSYEVVSTQAVRVSLPSFTAEDYSVILANCLGAEEIGGVDINKMFRFSSKLSGYQLTALCHLLTQKGQIPPSTADMIACVSEHILTSNTHVDEVEPVSFSDLKGAEELIEMLEANILLPMQDTERAEKLGLKPKRGVLLHGQPGTGKTSVGRALAHQMKGKFFMIDGTFISEPPNKFFARVRQVFEDAKSNSPSVIFIDDADVLFKTDHVYGLNRYLLTMLDGLESETIGNVCVMMTAMNVSDMPPALLRSGRVELWLETKLPDHETRKQILKHYTKSLPAEHQAFDMLRLLQLTNGFTPADLRRIVADAKALLVFDEVKQRPQKAFGAYMLKAAENLRELKEKLGKVLGYQLPKVCDLDSASSCCG